MTGGAGNIGGSLCRRLVKNSNYHVDIIDDLSTGSELKLPSLNYKNWNFYKCDINDNPKFQKIVSSKNYDYVFHYAAVVGVQRTLSNPKLVLNDIEGIKNILNYSANNKVKKNFFPHHLKFMVNQLKSPKERIQPHLIQNYHMLL